MYEGYISSIKSLKHNLKSTKNPPKHTCSKMTISFATCTLDSEYVQCVHQARRYPDLSSRSLPVYTY